jgi:hypothetical protein
MRSLGELNVLVGHWQMSGRTVGEDHDNMDGEVMITWLAEPTVLTLVGSMSFDGESIESVEIVWFDPDSQRGLAHVSGGDSGPLDYWWDIDGSTLKHGDQGSTYTERSAKTDRPSKVGRARHRSNTRATTTS